MQNAEIDSKLAILTEQYADQGFARRAAREVEEIRRHAFNVGLFLSAAAFSLNEVARLTLRSRKSKRAGNCFKPVCVIVLYSHVQA